MTCEPKKFGALDEQSRARSAHISAVLKTSLSFLGEWRIAMPAASGFIRKQLLKHGKPPKGMVRQGAFKVMLRQQQLVSSACVGPALTAQHKNRGNITGVGAPSAEKLPNFVEVAGQGFAGEV
jgi:hypothetical protein